MQVWVLKLREQRRRVAKRQTLPVTCFLNEETQTVRHINEWYKLSYKVKRSEIIKSKSDNPNDSDNCNLEPFGEGTNLHLWLHLFYSQVTKMIQINLITK
jgi:hypothetical protein